MVPSPPEVGRWRRCKTGTPQHRQRQGRQHTERAAKDGAATPAKGRRSDSSGSSLWGEKVAEPVCSFGRVAAFTPCAGEVEEGAGQAARAAPDASPCADRETS